MRSTPVKNSRSVKIKNKNTESFAHKSHACKTISRNAFNNFDELVGSENVCD